MLQRPEEALRFKSQSRRPLPSRARRLRLRDVVFRCRGQRRRPLWHFPLQLPLRRGGSDASTLPAMPPMVGSTEIVAKRRGLLPVGASVSRWLVDPSIPQHVTVVLPLQSSLQRYRQMPGFVSTLASSAGTVLWPDAVLPPLSASSGKIELMSSSGMVSFRGQP